MCSLLWESLSREIKIEEAMEAKLLSKLELSCVLTKWLIQYPSRECGYPFKGHYGYILPQPQLCPFGKIRSCQGARSQRKPKGIHTRTVCSKQSGRSTSGLSNNEEFWGIKMEWLLDICIFEERIPTPSPLPPLPSLPNGSNSVLYPYLAWPFNQLYFPIQLHWYKHHHLMPVGDFSDQTMQTSKNLSFCDSKWISPPAVQI